MKTILIHLTVCCLSITLLAGCTLPYGDPTVHAFLQSRDCLVKVEVCTNSESYNWTKGREINSLETLVELSPTEIDSLWYELLAFPAFECSNSRVCDDLLFVFSYENGQREFIGCGEIGVLNADGTFAGFRGHAFIDGESLAKLFAKYADPALLREVSKDFRSYYK